MDERELGGGGGGGEGTAERRCQPTINEEDEDMKMRRELISSHFGAGELKGGGEEREVGVSGS